MKLNQLNETFQLYLKQSTAIDNIILDAILLICDLNFQAEIDIRLNQVTEIKINICNPINYVRDLNGNIIYFHPTHTKNSTLQQFSAEELTSIINNAMPTILNNLKTTQTISLAELLLE